MFLLPAERKIGGRHHLDKVHEVVRLLVCVLLSSVQGVDVVVRPAAGSSRLVLLLHVLDDDVAQLRAKSKVVDLVRERVCLVLEVVLQVVDVEIAVRERFSRSDVEVTDDFIDSNSTFNTATFLALCVQVFGIVFTLALLDALAATEGPGD